MHAIRAVEIVAGVVSKEGMALKFYSLLRSIAIICWNWEDCVFLLKPILDIL